MGERLRCANCTGHVAYECDKRFDEAVALSLFDEVIERRPAREFRQVEGKLQMTEHEPGSSFAIDKAIDRRNYQSRDMLKELQVEL